MFYSGKVTDKRTGKPMAGVPVSDGRNVVLTDAEGRYSLPGWERSHTVSVSMLTNAHDDWYYFTGGVAGNYDFAVTPAKTDRFEILHVSDTEITLDRDVEWVSFLQELCRKEMPAFLIHTGDITRREGIILHRETMNFDTMGCPVRYVIGNHDYAAAADPTVTYGEQPYEEEAGPVWYSFDCGGVHCAVLRIAVNGKSYKSACYTPEDQWAWLKNDLEIAGKGKPLVLFEHSAGPDCYEFIMGDTDLKQLGLLAWIYGHSHTNKHHVRSGVHSICTGRAHTGGIDASPSAARRIKIEDGKVSSQMCYRTFPVAPADTALWQTKLPGNVLCCEPVLHNGDLLVGTMCEALPGQNGLGCICAETGEIRWFFETKGNGIANNFALDGDRVYFQDTMGYVYCLNANTGEKYWETELMLGGTGHAKQPVAVVGDLVFAGHPASSFALNKKDGTIAAQMPAPKKGGQTTARTVYVPRHNCILFNAQWGALRCVDAKSLQVLWERTEKPLWYRNNTPCVDGDVVYAGGFDKLLKLDIHTGQTLQETDIGEPAQRLGAPQVESDGNMNVCGAPVIDGDILYCPTASSGVLAIDKNTLEVLRRYPTGPACLLTAPYVKQGAQMVESSPVICDEQLIFTAMDGKLYIYNKHTAQPIKTINIPAPSLVAPVVTQNALYTADFEGNICKYMR